jgi:hypothetical protein
VKEEEAQTAAALLSKGAAAEKLAEEAAARARAAEEAEAEEEEERRRKAKVKREADGAIVNTKAVEKPPTPDAELQLCLVWISGSADQRWMVLPGAVSTAPKTTRAVPYSR